MKAGFLGRLGGAKIERSKQTGLSTIELLVAMTILLMGLTGAVAVSFGIQSILGDSQASSEALNKAQTLLENTQSLARKDFKLANPIPAISDQEFTKSLSVEVMADYFTKKLTAEVAWIGENNRKLKVELSALVTDFENAGSGETCSSVLTGNWQSPRIKNGNPDFSLSIGAGGGVYPITDVNAYLNKLYITVGSTALATDPTFFIFDVSSPHNPVFLGKVDNSAQVTAGLKAVATNGQYAYAASARAVSADPNFGQLQIFDITNPTAPILIRTFKVPGITVTNSTQGLGNSIFYKDGYVYLGLTKTGSGPEFNIIDVRDPNAPFYIGGYSIGSTVNALVVKKGLAYLTSPSNEELIVLNVNNPLNPAKAGGFDAAGGSGNGKSLYLVGDQVYLGRTVGGTEFYVLNGSNQNLTPLPVVGYKNDVDASMNGLIVRDYLAAYITNNEFRLLKVSDPLNLSQYGTGLNLPASGSGEEPSMDCEGNNFFVSSNDSTGRGFLYVIAP